MRDQNQPPSLCNYYLKGHCKFGEQCKDLHPSGKCVGNDLAGGDKYKVEDYMTIYVCNIPDFIDEENLNLIAEEHGKVVRMPNIIRISRISSGLLYGFIQMTCRYAAADTVDHINELELADGSFMSARIDEEKSRYKQTWKDLRPSTPEVNAWQKNFVELEKMTTYMTAKTTAMKKIVESTTLLHESLVDFNSKFGATETDAAYAIFPSIAQFMDAVTQLTKTSTQGKALSPPVQSSLPSGPSCSTSNNKKEDNPRSTSNNKKEDKPQDVTSSSDNATSSSPIDIRLLDLDLD